MWSCRLTFKCRRNMRFCLQGWRIRALDKIESEDVVGQKALWRFWLNRTKVMGRRKERKRDHNNKWNVWHSKSVDQSHYRPEQALRVPGSWGPTLEDNRHMKVVWLSALRTGHLYSPPPTPPKKHSCWRLSQPQDHSAVGRIMSLKNSNDTIGNRNRDMSICSVASVNTY